MRTIHTNIFVVLAALCCGLSTKAQELSISYTSELQTAFHDKTNWVNLLQTEGDLKLCRNVSAGISTISTCSTHTEPLISDMLTYSNIEEENIPIAIARLGLNINLDKWRLFAGVGNVNDNFFATPLTSLFTNSSCGIFPTISCNFNIANYPDASVGIESSYDNKNITINSAIYNGQAYHGFTGNNCVFRVRPLDDGIFNINAINYHKNDNNYNLGIGIHHGRSDNDDTRAQKSSPATSTKKKETNFFYWAYAEQKIIRNLSLIAQYSQCPTIEAGGCKNFYGGGFAYKAGRYNFGLYACFAQFTTLYEWANELTLRYKISEYIDLQPSLHYIRNNATKGIAGLLRIYITL